MKSFWLQGAKVGSGLFIVALAAMPQSYTISARPGAVNYLEGEVMLNNQQLATSDLKSTFMNAGDLLETGAGKAEILLTPGVFLRVGDHSRVRMLKPSLIDTQVAVEAGESMMEVDQYVKDSHLTISLRGGLTEIQKNGLYRFMADGDPSVAAIDGKAEVSFGEKHISISKGHEALLSDELKTRAFDKDRPDELFAWSNIRSQYNASLTYQAAQSARTVYGSSAYNNAGYGNGYGGGGYSGFYGQGWYWNNGFNSWLWMPGGQFFSPFGWGFYGPGFVGYAPVVYVPVVAGGAGVGKGVGVGVIPPHPIPVPVNPKQLPSLGVVAASPAQLSAARIQSSRMVSASGGLRMASPSGSNLPGPRWSGNGGGSGMQSRSSGSFGGGGAASHSSGGGMSSHASGGGTSSGGGMSSHASGGGGGASSGHSSK
jgi:hypothetical protein